MGQQDMSDMDRLRELFEAFSRKREILGCSSAAPAPHGRAGVHRRGERPGPLDACTVITAPYASAAACSACWASSARPAWPTTG
jgi:heat-inducible transcriptional repressor